MADTTLNLNPNSSTMRNYQHASKIFVGGNNAPFRLSPKYGFLFYVEFELNESITQIKKDERGNMGLVVKTATLPKFTIDNKIQNAYNRKNVVQQKINYDPVTISFHDDQADLIRNFWYDYYSFYYRDSDYNDALYSQQTKYVTRPVPDWGYTPRPVPSYSSGYVAQQYQYINSITLYSLYQKNFSAYQLINPTIISFKHGELDNSANDVLQHDMTLAYEAVKYKTGFVTPGVAGWLNLSYDTEQSPLSPPGFGPDSIIDPSGTISRPPKDIKDLADNNIHPGEMANNPLSTLAGFGSVLAGDLLNGITAGVGSLVGSVVSSGISSLTSKFSIPSPGDAINSLMSKVSSASQQLQNEIAGASSDVEKALGITKSSAPPTTQSSVAGESK